MPSFPLFNRLFNTESDMQTGPPQWLIVGLGNPGTKYTKTRHNAGWHVLDTIVRDNHQFRFDEKRKKAEIARGHLAGIQIALVKPQTYMNLSGEAISPLAQFYKIPPEQILIIYDDLDLPLGTMRIRPKGGAGGHKGMKSAIQHLGTQEFPRIRLGIGRPPGRMPVEAYVLQKFTATEFDIMVSIYEQTVEAIEMLISTDLEQTMNLFNKK